MDFPSYRDTKISAHDLIAKLQGIKGFNTDSMHHVLRSRDRIAFDAGMAAAVGIIWDYVLEQKRREYNAAAVKYNNAVRDDYKIPMLPIIR
jgi:hypothetical protein